MEHLSERTPPLSDERTGELEAEFKRRLGCIRENYRACRMVERESPSVNESLGLLAKGVNPRAHRSKKRQRLHPIVEMAVSECARTIHREAGGLPGERPTPDQVFEASKRVLDRSMPIRGRPKNAVLEHHVHGLMALMHDTSGAQAQAAITKNSVYERRMTNLAGLLVEQFFRSADPSISSDTLAGIVYAANRSGAVTGKRFRDFFPLYGRSREAVSFEPNFPIYCS